MLKLRFINYLISMRKSLDMLGLRGGLHSLQVTQVKGSMHGEGFLEVLEPLVLLDLHLLLLPIHPYQHLLLLVS
jgi:hypothetical protein